MSIIRSIIERLKIKELFGITFIACLFMTFLPDSIAKYLSIYEFRNKCQLYLTIVMIFISSYYLYHGCNFIFEIILSRINSKENRAMKYLKKHITPDEMGLIFEVFYDESINRFKSSGVISLQDGRIVPLEQQGIIYKASAVGNFYQFPCNLQPYVFDFLNRSLSEGNIQFDRSMIRWNFNK